VFSAPFAEAFEQSFLLYADYSLPVSPFNLVFNDWNVPRTLQQASVMLSSPTEVEIEPSPPESGLNTQCEWPAPVYQDHPNPYLYRPCLGLNRESYGC